MGELVVKIVFMALAPVAFTIVGLRDPSLRRLRAWSIALVVVGAIALGFAFFAPREVRPLVTPFLLLSPSALATLGVLSRSPVRSRKALAMVLGPLTYLAIWFAGFVVCITTGFIGG